MEPMTPEQIRVVNYIEQHWHGSDTFPPVGRIKQRFPDLDLDATLKHETFRYALTMRGIDAPVGVVDNNYSMIAPDELTKEQLAAITVMLNFNDTRSRTAKLKDLGISATQWAGWMKNKAFKEYVHDLSANNFQDALNVAHEGLLKSVDRGDTNAVKLYMELTGRYTAESTQMGNIKMVLAKLVESIQRHVTDPEVLRAIERDFEATLQGKPVEVPRQLDRTI